jgi:phosphatidylglycerol---prolipoprotein diacylglyceryl transferase
MIDGFTLGPLYIRFYGILLMSGALAGGYLATLEMKRRGHDPEMVWDLLVYLIVGGIIGARLWHVLTPPPSSIAQGFTTQYYLTHPLDALAIWKGGLGIPGTILGGLVAMYLYARAHRGIGFLEWTDIAAPSLALGQAIGRWGNFFNQELYGAPTNLPWKIFIGPTHRLAGYENSAFYHPLFAYESILNLANMLLLLWLMRRYRSTLRLGDVFNVYLIAYPLIRFSLDFLRLDASQVLSLNINQTLSAVVGVCAVLVLLWRHRSSAAGEERAVPPSPAVMTPPAEAEARPAVRKPRRTPVKRAIAKRVAKRPSAPKKRRRTT